MLDYRHTLTRAWDSDLPRIAWICLNPSTADQHVDDPTTRKIRGFSERWGFGSYVLVNLCPMRATKPRDLIAASALERVGNPDDASFAVRHAVRKADATVLAWGTNGGHKALRGRVRQVCANVHQVSRLHPDRHEGVAPRPVWSLGFTKNRQPKHPLMPAYTTRRRVVADADLGVGRFTVLSEVPL